MPGAEAADINRLISKTIFAIQSATEVSIDDAEDLPQAFQEVAKRLPLIQETLEVVKKRILESSLNEKSCQDMKPAVEACEDKATRLDEIFYKVVPKSDAPRMERYRKVAGKGDRVEDLMKQMLRHILALAEKPILKPAIQAQVGELQKALEELSAIPPSLPDDDSSFSFHNYGSGSQNVHTGSGPQNNNTGSGYQFNGTFQAPFQFPLPPPSSAT